MRSIQKLIFFIFLVVGSASQAKAYDCSPADITLTTQAEVDALGASGCDNISGDLEIFNYSLDDRDITNIDSLANLISIEGSLRISDTRSITHIDGLVNLKSVGGYLEIFNNAALTNVDGLTSLSSVEGDLGIGLNDLLTKFDGLSNLESIGGDLWINSNEVLTSINGLASLTYLGGYLSVEDNNALKDINGLTNLKSIQSYLDISRNDALTSINGLSSLTSIGADPTRVQLEIHSNAVLASIDGLLNLENVVGDLVVYNNNSLNHCEALAQVFGWPIGPPGDGVTGRIRLATNRTGCNSVEEVLVSVPGPTKPTITKVLATESDSVIRLEFIPSTPTDDLFPVTGYRAACVGAFSDVNESPALALRDNTPVTRSLEISGYGPVSVMSTIEVDIDIKHEQTRQLDITLTTPEGSELILWSQQSGDANLVGTFPETLTPVDTISTVGFETMNGDWMLSVEDAYVGTIIREGVLNSWGLRVTEEVISSGTASPINIPFVIAGRDYSCTIAPVTTLGASPVSDSFVASSLLDNDSDGDGLNDNIDNCPNIYNEDQADNDSDGEGDACDADDDNDGTNDEDDAFPFDDTESLDTDGDGIGNNEDYDDDADGILDSFDNAPLVVNTIVIDSDNDGVIDSVDAYPNDPTKQYSGTGDLDGDGYSNDEEVDYCTNPFDKNSQPELGGLSLPLIQVITEQ